MFALHALQTGTGEEQAQPAWQALARCSNGTGSMLELFFSEQIDDINAAKAFCLECPVREPCLEGAVARREPWGVWGGQLFLNGKVLPQKRKRGRPPKVRPEVISDGMEMTEGPTAQTA
jgi:WhiB family redox-sensing transcriptional regulator